MVCCSVHSCARFRMLLHDDATPCQVRVKHTQEREASPELALSIKPTPNPDPNPDPILGHQSGGGGDRHCVRHSAVTDIQSIGDWYHTDIKSAKAELTLSDSLSTDTVRQLAHINGSRLNTSPLRYTHLRNSPQPPNWSLFRCDSFCSNVVATLTRTPTLSLYQLLS